MFVQGNYIWLSDEGHLGKGAKVVRFDIATGVSKDIRSPLISSPLGLAAGGHYLYVMNVDPLGRTRPTLIRINESTLVVSAVYTIPGATQYDNSSFVVEGDDVWIPASLSLIRVNTTTLVASTFKSSLFAPGYVHSVSDSQYLWTQGPQSTLRATSQGNLTRVSLASGAVITKSIPGLDGEASPMAFDGTNLWVSDIHGIERVDIKTGRVTRIVMPKAVTVTVNYTDGSEPAVTRGGVYFLARILSVSELTSGLIRVDTVSGRVTTVTSPLLISPFFVASAGGPVWVVNTPSIEMKIRQPILVRVSPHS
jgi:hypothetical protein